MLTKDSHFRVAVFFYSMPLNLPRSLPIFLLIIAASLSCSDMGGKNTDKPSLPQQPANPSLPLEMSWQIQYTGGMNFSLDVDMYNLDLFETDAETISSLKERGVFVMCYFSAGSHEDWQIDAQDFPSETFGNPMQGWEGETWLDIRQIEILKPVMEARLDLAAEKNCDGVDPDNVNGYENETGFPLTYQDQLAFNIFLAEAAHARGLRIGLKNNIFQIDNLQPYFDWAINEDCFSFNECKLLLPFVRAGKPVFIIDYGLIPWSHCLEANEMGLNLLNKHRSLDAYRISCW